MTVDGMIFSTAVRLSMLRAKDGAAFEIAMLMAPAAMAPPDNKSTILEDLERARDQSNFRNFIIILMRDSISYAKVICIRMWKVELLTKL